MQTLGVLCESISLVNSFGQNGHHFTDIFQILIFLYENGCIWLKFQFVHERVQLSKLALFQVMVGHLLGAEPLPEPMFTKMSDAT